jgi:cell division protein FtsW (lipid II flippase)
MPRVLAASTVVVISESVAGVALGEPALLGSASLTAGFAVLIVVAGALFRRGHERSVAPMLAASVYLLGLLSAILIPGAATAAAMLPILSVVLLLPGRRRAAIMAILAVALGGSVLTLLMAGVPHPFPPMREPLGTAFASATLLGVAVLILGALTDFAIQA